MTANSFGSRAALQAAGQQYEIYRLDALDGSAGLPFSLKILLENLLRNEDGVPTASCSCLSGDDPAAGSWNTAATAIFLLVALCLVASLAGQAATGGARRVSAASS